MRRLLAPALALLVVVPATIGLVERIGLATPAPSEHTAFARLAQSKLGDDHGPVVVALVTPDSTQYATFGASNGDAYEIASLTKLMTAQLLTESVDRGEVDLDTKVGDLLEIEGPQGQATLEQLATYAAGFGEWGPPERTLSQFVVEHLLAGNPWDIDSEELIDRAQRDPLNSRGRFGYSNLSFALLGQALAAAADMSYERLLRERVIEPLNMTNTRIGYASDLNQTRGLTAAGRRSAPWNLGAFAPAGGVRSTIDDMSTWARSVLDPASAAGRTLAHGGGVGWGWYRTIEPNPMAWKSGGSGGFASAIAVDPDQQLAVVVLSGSAVEVDAIAREVLSSSR